MDSSLGTRTTGTQRQTEPDLIFVKEEVALLVDPIVIWERNSACLEKASEAKVTKYGSLQNEIREKFDVKEVQVFGRPLNRRRVDSAE